jgi:hypothetical protein
MVSSQREEHASHYKNFNTKHSEKCGLKRGEEIGYFTY